MDACEATNVLISKIKKIDPENAPKIMGYILLQGLSDSNLSRLASSSEVLLRNVVFKVKAHLGISPASFSAPPSNPSSPSPLNPISRPVNPFSQRVAGSDALSDFLKSSSAHSWPLSCIPSSAGSNGNSESLSPKSSPFLSYDNIRSGSAVVPPFLKSSGGDSAHAGGDFMEEYAALDDYLSFLDDNSSKNEEAGSLRSQLGGGFVVDNGDSHYHRRRFSESDVSSRVEEGGLPVGFRPCMYYARGFCKNGDHCKYIHSGFCGEDGLEGLGNAGGSTIGSPREIEGLIMQQHDDLVRMKVAQNHAQQRLAYDKYMNFLMQQREDPLRMGSAMSEELQKLSRFRPERSDFFAMGMADKSNSAARQIYLTFPADSAFRDEDVSNYFSTFGPVQDVRIPYQQKRMFGFVTFVHPETVKLILARGNPHFICESRVLVKPYKEKGKLINELNRRQQHLQQHLMERGNFSPCSCPPARIDPHELYDLHLEARMIQDAQELILRRKLGEQVELQQAIELQGRRLLNLQLPDLRHDYAHHHLRSPGGTSLPLHINNNIALNENPPGAAVSGSNDVGNPSDEWKSGKIESHDIERICGGNSEHTLPDHLFGSPRSTEQNLDPFPPLSKQSLKSETAAADEENIKKKPHLQ